MDIFDTKNIKPMLIVDEVEPFDSEDYIYELKFDGIRGICYLDSNSTELRNKRNKIMNNIFPELMQIHKNINQRCILDGEYVVLTDGKPDFYELQKRSLMSNKFRIEQAGKKKPVIFVAYDILYTGIRQVTELPLLERKALLGDAFNETLSLSVSRYITGKGIDFFNLALQEKLEGIVAKRKDSKYYIGKNTKDWLKIKVKKDDDLIICGYIFDDFEKIKSLILGAYDEGRLISRGHVTFGLSGNVERTIKEFASSHIKNDPTFVDERKSNVVWFAPELVCVVEYMPSNKEGMRQAVFKGLRDDKKPEECIVK